MALVARQGDPAAGVTDDARFNVFLNPSLNAPGQVAFLARLAGPGVGDAQGNAFGIWAQSINGGLELIAREGDAMEVEPGDLRTIARLSFATESGGEDGRARGFNQRGQVAFGATFTDGTSAILISNRVAIPEPSGALLAFLATAGSFAVAVRK